MNASPMCFGLKCTLNLSGNILNNFVIWTPSVLYGTHIPFPVHVRVLYQLETHEDDLRHAEAVDRRVIL